MGATYLTMIDLGELKQIKELKELIISKSHMIDGDGLEVITKPKSCSSSIRLPISVRPKVRHHYASCIVA